MNNDPNHPNHPNHPNQPFLPAFPASVEPQSQKQKKNPWSWYKRQRNIAKIGIGCGVLLVAGLACCAVSIAIAGPTSMHSAASKSIATMAATATPRVQQVTQEKATPRLVPTSTPTPVLTPTPVPVISSTGTTLGASLDNFKAKYGNPDSSSQPNNGMYNFDNMAVSIFAFKQDNGLVSSIIYAQPNEWANMEKATTACLPFLPSDAKFSRTAAGANDDIQRVYTSVSIAKMFPASRFSDENGDQTTVGTIAIIYAHDLSNSNNIVQCIIQVGLEGK